MSDEKVHVKIGEIKIARDTGTLFTIGLGSCVAVAMYDPTEKVCGMAHVMLPDPIALTSHMPGRSASTAVPELLRLMEASGARKPLIYARIVGGAAMFESVLPAEGLRLGERNVEAVKHALSRAHVPLRGEDVGGSFGRSVFFHAADGTLLVRAVKRDDVVL